MSNDKKPFEAFPVEPGLYNISIAFNRDTYTLHGHFRLRVDLDDEETRYDISGTLDDKCRIRGRENKDGVLTINRQHPDGRQTIYQLIQSGPNSYAGGSAALTPSAIEAVTVRIRPRGKGSEIPTNPR